MMLGGRLAGLCDSIHLSELSLAMRTTVIPWARMFRPYRRKVTYLRPRLQLPALGLPFALGA